MNTILLTGAGFIGSNFVRFVLEHRPDVNLINVDSLTYSGNPENLADIDDDPQFKDRYTFVKADIRDLERMTELFAKLAPVTQVVHIAPRFSGLPE
jgi:dTDP-glucose 4,6-dehydratase